MMKKLLFLLFAVIGTTASLTAQNLLSTYNEGFESINGTATGNTPYYWWNFFNDTAATAILTDQTTTIHSGTHAAKVVVGTAAAGYQPQLANGKTLALTIGNTYTVSFWIKAVSGGGTVQSSNSGSSLYGPNFTTSTSWTQYSQTFTANATDYQLWIHLGGFVDTYYVDDTALVAGSVALGLESYNSKNSSIYPNPVIEKLNINSDSTIKMVTISDLNGKTVKTIKSAENIESVNLSDLSKGMYLLKTDTNKLFKFLKN
ncbi:T9SS type A sorting domain-containing protein [Flavobacterium cellulosilyticum]|uniref:T9SS type A sorting domain-containing protein n=1 Tax=Flavobacterium cellulosilyticum TaxID=2541731 RepID=A0A4V2YZX0_9FLAO|nr:T9SS type A sorting domain-containing protein [Flavobacterium cellulosilyticum]TDD98747.1 T9SS type A sorting domain-containing protein [Flavobacterium cellulosilyticum]